MASHKQYLCWFQKLISGFSVVRTKEILVCECLTSAGDLYHLAAENVSGLKNSVKRESMQSHDPYSQYYSKSNI